MAKRTFHPPYLEFVRFGSDAAFNCRCCGGEGEHPVVLRDNRGQEVLFGKGCVCLEAEDRMREGHTLLFCGICRTPIPPDRMGQLVKAENNRRQRERHQANQRMTSSGPLHSTFLSDLDLRGPRAARATACAWRRRAQDGLFFSIAHTHLERAMET